MYNCSRNRRSHLGPRPGDYTLGSMESRAAARLVQLIDEMEAREKQAVLFKNLTPFEQANIEDLDNPGAQAYMLSMLRDIIIPKYEMYGWPLPTPEELRHNWQVSKEIEKIMQEREALGGKAFLTEETLRTMAEERLQRKRHG